MMKEPLKGEGCHRAIASTLLEPTGQTNSLPDDDGLSRGQSTRSFRRFDLSLRRFIAASVAGASLVLIPYLWVLFALWEPWNLFRTTGGTYSYDKFLALPPADNFYDLQARAIFHGHLYLPNGSIGLEAFVHNGHEYTYFGLFPSLLRMPILLVTHTLDGRLTSISIFLAWLFTALFTMLLTWRVRILIRGQATVSRAEAASLGVLMATLLGGSVLVFLAANPYVYSEDLIWSVALSTGSFFALLGVLERPSWGRVVVSGVLVLAAYNTRVTTGLACAIGALMVSVWFALGRQGAQNRKWWLPMLAVGFVPIVIGCAINWVKFGQFFGFELSDQLSSIAFHRGSVKDFSVSYLPTTLHAYLQPIGLQFGDVFPYITMPPEVHANPSIVTDPTASLPASMPLTFLVGVWGTICALWPRSPGRMSVLRLLLVASAVSCGALLIFGWILERYVADFLPFFIMASAVGIVDVWRRLERRRWGSRTAALAVISILGLFSVAANFGIAISPTETWSSLQARNYVELQKSISDVTGHPLATQVIRGQHLSLSWAPRGQLFVLNDCSFLFISDGLGQKGVPNLGSDWLPVEQAPDSSLCRSIEADR
jgi:hypothetical protein